MIHYSTTLGHRMVSYYRGFLNSEVGNIEGPLHLCLFCCVRTYVRMCSQYIRICSYVRTYVHIRSWVCMYVYNMHTIYICTYLHNTCMYVCMHNSICACTFCMYRYIMHACIISTYCIL